jgi:ArsR family transcriptional regulator
MQLLLSTYPRWVAEIQSALGIPNSTLSHHPENLKNEELVKVRREGTFLWYTANTEALEELLGFLLCGMLHAQQGDQVRGHHHSLQIGTFTL